MNAPLWCFHGAMATAPERVERAVLGAANREAVEARNVLAPFRGTAEALTEFLKVTLVPGEMPR